MKGLNAVEAATTDIITALRTAGVAGEIIGELEKAVAQLADDSTRLEALRQIQGMCHVKDLGDLNMGQFSDHEWWNLLARLGTKCGRAIRRVEREGHGCP